MYLLGATLHNVLTGKPRHEGDSLYGVLFAARDSLPYPYGPEIPPELAAICNKATSADPEARYPTALALRRAVAEYLRHKGSIALCDAATAQLAEVRALSTRVEGGGAHPRRVHRIMAECRAGFTQALHAWKDNAAARVGLSECLAAMIEHELSQEDREGAAALIAELPEPRPDLVHRLAALDAALHERRERDARLRRLEHDLDLSVGARPRLVGMALLTATSVALSVWALSHDSSPFGHRERIVHALLIDGILGAAIAFGRKRLMATTIGRTSTGFVLVWMVANLGHALLAARFGMPLAADLAIDLWLTGSVLAASAVALRRGLHWSAVPCIVGALLSAAWPDQALVVCAVAGVSSTAIASVITYRLIAPRR